MGGKGTHDETITVHIRILSGITLTECILSRAGEYESDIKLSGGGKKPKDGYSLCLATAS